MSTHSINNMSLLSNGSGVKSKSSKKRVKPKTTTPVQKVTFSNNGVGFTSNNHLSAQQTVTPHFGHPGHVPPSIYAPSLFPINDTFPVANGQSYPPPPNTLSIDGDMFLPFPSISSSTLGSNVLNSKPPPQRREFESINSQLQNLNLDRTPEVSTTPTHDSNGDISMTMSYIDPWDNEVSSDCNPVECDRNVDLTIDFIQKTSNAKCSIKLSDKGKFKLATLWLQNWIMIMDHVKELCYTNFQIIDGDTDLLKQDDILLKLLIKFVIPPIHLTLQKLRNTLLHINLFHSKTFLCILFFIFSHLTHVCVSCNTKY